MGTRNKRTLDWWETFFGKEIEKPSPDFASKMDRLKDSFATLTSADGWKDMMEDEGLEYGHGLNLGGVLEKLDGSKEQLFKKDEEIVFPG